MKRLRKVLGLERLESRETPAISVTYTPTNLNITGRPVGDLTIKHVGPASNVFQVLDGAKSYGTYAVNNLWIQTPSRPGDIRIDLDSTSGQGVIPGNVYVDLGLGSNDTNPLTLESVDIYDSGVVPLGVISGTVQIINGNGRETIQIGRFGDSPATSPSPVTISGSVFTSLRTSGNITGDVLDIDDGTTIKGNVVATQTDGVNIGRQLVGGTGAVIGGSVVSNNPGTGSGTGNFLNVYGTVYGSVTQYGTTRTDTFNLQVTDVGVGGLIMGNLTASLGDGGQFGNRFNCDVGTVVEGSVNVVSGIETSVFGYDEFKMAGSVYGNTNLTMGGGVNIVNVFAGANQLGVFTATGGNVSNNVTLSGNFDANVTVLMGSGSNTALLDGYFGPANVKLTGGSGTNNFTYDALFGSVPYLTVNFGAGNNTFTWGTVNMIPSTANIAGATISAAKLSTNTYNVNGFTFGPELTLVNFP